MTLEKLGIALGLVVSVITLVVFIRKGMKL